MTDGQPAAPGRLGFVRGNERLDQLLADPQLAAVAAAHADAEWIDRVYAMNLAMIRKAAQMTQVEVGSLASARAWCRGYNTAMTCCCPPCTTT